MERSEVREIDIRYKASGLTETIANLNRLVAAEEGVVVVTEKVERSDKSLERSLGAIQGKYVENHRLVQQVTRDMNLLHEAKARGIVDANAYTAALAGMESRLNAVAASQGVVIERSRGWAALSASSTGTYGPMMAQVKAAEDRLTALQRAEAKLRSINAAAATQAGQPGRAPPDPNRRREYATNQALMQGFDILPQLAAGVNPATILIQQGPQVAQSWAMAGMSMKDGLKDVGSRVMGVITPVRALTAGVTALGVAATLSFLKFSSSITAVDVAARGLGRSLGMTGREVAAIAEASADAGGLSRSAAREMAASYVATGKIGRGELGGLIEISRDFATTTGVEVADAVSDLAKAYADPARGAQELTAKLGFLNDRELGHIQRLQAMGDRAGAAAALHDALSTALVKTEEKMNAFQRSWETLGRRVSNATDRIGEFIDAWGRVGQLDPAAFDRIAIEGARKRIEQRKAGGLMGLLLGGDSSQDEKVVADAQKRMADRAAKAASDAREQANKKAVAAGATARSLVPGAGAMEDLLEKQAELAASINDPNIAAGARNLDVNREALARVTAAINSYLPPAEKARRLRELDIASINARTPAERAEIAAMRARIEASGDVATALDAENEARAASVRVMAEARREADDYVASQTEASRTRSAIAHLEIQTIGATAQESDRLRAVMELTNEARQRAFQLTGDYNAVSAQTVATINREAEALARLGQIAREKRAVDDLAFRASQIGLNRADQEAMAALRSAGLLQNGRPVNDEARRLADQIKAVALLERQVELTKDLAFERESIFRSDLENQIAERLRSANIAAESAYGRHVAEIMRVNDALLTVKDTLRQPFTSFMTDIASGKGLKEAASGAAKMLGARMAEQSANNLYDSIWSSIGDAVPGLKGLGLGPKPDGSSAARALYVQIVGGAGATDLLGKVANDAFGLKTESVARSALPQIPGTTANDNYLPKYTGLTGGVNQRVAQAFDAGGWLTYSNQNATRSQPLDPRLVRDFAFLKDMGVRMDVFSGGQPGKGSGLPRVGSTRHDHGNAADVMFYRDGRQLDWRNPADLPTYQQIVAQARANGVTGFGAGPGYMRPGSMHVGYGAPGVWGAGGSGANAPSWLRDAYYSPSRLMGGASTDALRGGAGADQLDVKGVNASLRTLEQASTNAADRGIVPLGENAATASQAAGNFGQTLGAGLGGILGTLLGGKKNGALGGILGMFAGQVLGGGMDKGGWLTKILGFADGGYTGQGGRLQPAGLVHKGEVVWSQADIARSGGVAAVEGLRRGVNIPARLARPVVAQPQSVTRTYRGGDLVIQGNVTEDVLPKVEQMIRASNDQMTRRFAYERENEWRRTG